MNWMFEISSHPIAIKLSLVLLHFLWQGILVAGLTSLLLACVGTNKASARYAITCLGLVAMVIFPAFTYSAIHLEEEPGNVLVTRPAPMEIVPLQDAIPLPPTVQTDLKATPDANELFAHDIEPIAIARLTSLGIWVLIECWLGCRMFLSACLIWRIRRAASTVSTEVRQVTSKLAKQLGVNSVPAVLESEHIHDAITCGFLRSCIIVPSSWLTQMSPEMLEAVIAHELSHVKRHDVWVNLLQRLVETAFFYHPAVWWLSKQIRIEREHCCDAAAVRATGDAGMFARTLEFAAKQRVASQFVLVANLGEDRMSLLNRVHRVLATPNQSGKRRMDAWPLGMVAVLVPMLFVWTENQTSIAQETLPSPYYEYDDIQIYPRGPEFKTQLAGEAIETLQRFPEGFEQASFDQPEAAPNELRKVTLPDYVVEPPDILNIEAVALVPKDTFSVSPSDVFQIHEPNATISGEYAVEGEGTINLGPPYGVVSVAGLSVIEAKKQIVEHIAQHVKSPKTSVSLIRLGVDGSINGQFLVGPDGTITMGRYGTIHVTGATVDGAKSAIEKRLSKYFKKPRVSLNVFAYNSKFYYLIIEPANRRTGDQVVRVPVTGNETVLDAIAQLGGIAKASNSNLWISRPDAKSGKTKRFEVDWDAITRGKIDTNYQLMPGDRLFVSERNDGKPIDSGRGTTVDDGGGKTLSAMVDQFNHHVRNRNYEKAIKVARGIEINDDNRAIVEALTHHANLLASSLASVRDKQAKQAADLLGELRASRLADADAREALATPIQVKFNKTPLKKVLSIISVAIDKDILLNPKLLRDYAGLTDDEPITVELRKAVPARTALQLVLDPLGLSYSVRNGIIRVQFGDASFRDRHTQVYYVGDLLGAPFTAWTKDGEQTQELEWEHLGNLITSTVSPNQWADVGGPCNLDCFEGNLSLVVSAHPKVQEEVAKLLKEIRAITKHHPKSKQGVNQPRDASTPDHPPKFEPHLLPEYLKRIQTPNKTQGDAKTSSTDAVTIKTQAAILQDLPFEDAVSMVKKLLDNRKIDFVTKVLPLLSARKVAKILDRINDSAMMTELAVNHPEMIAECLQEMPRGTAAKAIKELVNGGNMKTAIQILRLIEPRIVSELLSNLSDPDMIAEIATRYPPVPARIR